MMFWLGVFGGSVLTLYISWLLRDYLEDREEDVPFIPDARRVLAKHASRSPKEPVVEFRVINGGRSTTIEL
jgi:hypothetical protein